MGIWAIYKMAQVAFITSSDPFQTASKVVVLIGIENNCRESILCVLSDRKSYVFFVIHGEQSLGSFFYQSRYSRLS
jgi:hypothetical protein